VSELLEKIEKRDGRIVEFDSSKITAAIAKAGNATGEFDDREARKLTLRVLTLAHEMRPGPTPEVEEIQDIVERVLLDSPYYKTAKAYILYREQHAQIRQMTTTFNVDLVDHYIQKMDWKIKENSNMSYSLQGLNNYISSKTGTSISTISACCRSIVLDGICRTFCGRVLKASKAKSKAHLPNICDPRSAKL
jgi:ribonucleoside-triphosphate reductase